MARARCGGRFRKHEERFELVRMNGDRIAVGRLDDAMRWVAIAIGGVMEPEIKLFSARNRREAANVGFFDEWGN